MAKIALCIIATNNYIDFVPPLLESAECYFLKGHEVDYHVFSNNFFITAYFNLTFHEIEHQPWPAMTLNRYKIILSAGLEGYDYIYYIDADSLFVDHVGDEILQDMIAVSHPGYYAKGGGSWETNPNSTAFTRLIKTNYVCGGFQGGRYFKNFAQIMQRNIETDTLAGITAVWHDESHLNAIFQLYRNQITLLPAHYMMPESINKRKAWEIYDLKPKIIALEKDHKNYQK